MLLWVGQGFLIPERAPWRCMIGTEEEGCYREHLAPALLSPPPDPALCMKGNTQFRLLTFGGHLAAHL